MKKTIYILTLIATITLVACGGSETENTTENVETVSLKGLEELNLSEYGYDLVIMIPKAEINGVADVKLTERGTLEIVIGMDYGLEIMFGDGDIELLKTDLKEGLVFNTEIITEEKNAIVYTQDIPDSGVKTQNHFMYRAEVGENIYEVRDIVEREYGLGMIEKMLESAKTIKAATSKKVEA
ncbi:MAG: hypothetical protein P8Q14_03755 [Vicingaceae bacterium]|nr:hypothetical protein [Vicingaceae bacterium]